MVEQEPRERLQDEKAALLLALRLAMREIDTLMSRNDFLEHAAEAADANAMKAHRELAQMRAISNQEHLSRKVEALEEAYLTNLRAAEIPPTKPGMSE